MKTGFWSVDFDISLENEEVNFDDLSESTQEYITDMIRDGFTSGEIIEEEDDDDDDYQQNVRQDEVEELVDVETEKEKKPLPEENTNVDNMKDELDQLQIQVEEEIEDEELRARLVSQIHGVRQRIDGLNKQVVTEL